MKSTKRAITSRVPKKTRSNNPSRTFNPSKRSQSRVQKRVKSLLRPTLRNLSARTNDL